MNQPHRIAQFSLLGGHPALDFVNTVDWRDRPAGPGGQEDLLVSYDALLALCGRLGLIDAAAEAMLGRLAAGEPARAVAVLDEARALREAVYRTVRAIQSGALVAASDLERINRHLRSHPERRVLSATRDGTIRWQSVPDEDLETPLAALARAAAELLVTAPPSSLRCCAGPGCGWLFQDKSPNRRRQWCSMESCGNRAKARRHYARVKATK